MQLTTSIYHRPGHTLDSMTNLEIKILKVIKKLQIPHFRKCEKNAFPNAPARDRAAVVNSVLPSVAFLNCPERFR
jgi:hypothetical protein